MKIKFRYRCNYWHRCEQGEFEVPDDSTREEIEKAIFEAALDMSGFECWQIEEEE